MSTPPAPPCLIAAVFLDGEYEDADYYRGWAQRAGLVVAANGGARFLLTAGLTPQVVVGDFDSLAPAAVELVQAAGASLSATPSRRASPTASWRWTRRCAGVRRRWCSRAPSRPLGDPWDTWPYCGAWRRAASRRVWWRHDSLCACSRRRPRLLCAPRPVHVSRSSRWAETP